MRGGNKRSCVLNQTCSRMLQICLTTYNLLLPLGKKELSTKIIKSPLDLKSVPLESSSFRHRNQIFYLKIDLSKRSWVESWFYGTVGS